MTELEKQDAEKFYIAEETTLTTSSFPWIRGADGCDDGFKILGLDS